MVQIIKVIFIIFQLLLIFYLIYPFLLYLIPFLKSKKKSFITTEHGHDEETDYAIIVTAYEQTTLIPSVIDSILKLNYSNYLVYVIADNCDVSNLIFTDSRVLILKPEEVLANNIKSHFYAIDHFQRYHVRLTIIDSDNLVHSEYLNELNKLFEKGYVAVQGVRRAKNLNSQYACLDEAGDMYYRFNRKLLFDTGSSAPLAGSGMAFTTSLYKECLVNLNMSGAGFDKALQNEIIKRDLKIAFAEDAIVYDEKTSKSDQLVKQRARWINTWFKFFIISLKMNISAIFNANWNQFLFTLMSLRPPLFLLFIISGLFFILDIFILPVFLPAWVIAGLLFIFIFYKSLFYFNANDQIYKSLRNTHKFVYYQLLALMKANKANELSIATKHEHQSTINDLKN